jgi:hypothetical protein
MNAQMGPQAGVGMAAAAFGSLLAVGLHWITWVFIAGATIATVSSRLLYHGRRDPMLERRKDE